MQNDGSPIDAAWEALGRFLPLEMLEAKLREAQRSLGRVNILLAGKTGCGKSTLVNAVFGASVAETGTGRPVTGGISWHEPPGLPLRLCDTRGLELAAFKETLAGLEAEIARCAATGRIEDRVHLAWVCISEQGARVEAAEQHVAALCERHSIPVVVVITRSFGLEEFEAAVRELMPGAGAVVPVMAEAMTRPPFASHGLEELVAETARLLPGAVERAFIAAQRIDRAAKRSAAVRIAAGAAATAGAAAAVPVPGAGTAGVLAINASMVVGIAVAMGVPMDSAGLLALGASVAGGLAASTGGRMLLGEALKLIPGVGSVIGGVLEVSVATATTYGLGVGFAEFLLWFSDQNARMPAGDEIGEAFRAYWAKRPAKVIEPPTPS